MCVVLMCVCKRECVRERKWREKSQLVSWSVGGALLLPFLGFFGPLFCPKKKFFFFNQLFLFRSSFVSFSRCSMFS